MNKVLRWIRKWLCCGNRRDDEVRRIYNQISQLDDDIWCGEI